MSNVDLMKLIQENVRSLKSYHVENNDCEVKLHANENPFPTSNELLELFKTSLRFQSKYQRAAAWWNRQAIPTSTIANDAYVWVSRCRSKILRQTN